MFTISCYAIHPLAARFLHLWRHVQVVSNWLVFLMSFLCCQCGQFMPMSQCSSMTEAQMVLPIIDPGRASGEPLRAQHVVVDFSPQPQDKLVETRCMEMWSLIRSHPELEGTMISPENQPVLNSPSVPVHKSPVPLSERDTYPAVKEINKIQDTHPEVAINRRNGAVREADSFLLDRFAGDLAVSVLDCAISNAQEQFQLHSKYK